MFKLIALLVAASCLGACSPAQPASSAASAVSAEKKEIIVFAAASLTETLEEIADLYQADHPDMEIVCNFDSSGTLKTQIEEGAPCDLFISASPKQMDQLDLLGDAAENPDGLDFVNHDSRIDLLENQVTLAVPDGNPAGIASFAQLADALRGGQILLAMGNSDVPVGQYTRKILEYYQLSEEDLAAAGCITYGTNVKEVTTQIAEASVDCGVIYSTDAFSAGLTVVDSATAAMCGQVLYPAALLKNAPNAGDAADFLEFLSSDTACAVFESVGFTCLAAS